MAKLIGGPAHGMIIGINPQAKKLIMPALPNNRQPRQLLRSMFQKWEYKRTGIIRDGETVFRFASGYYQPRKENE
jgi:hypothetical protein